METIYHQLIPLFQVIMIDVTLAGDNALVVGLAASRVQSEKRAAVLIWGTAGAVLVRVFLALIAAQLLSIVGLTLSGGVLLLWVGWKLARDLRPRRDSGSNNISSLDPAQRPMSFRTAIAQIVIADVSMSLDNVLAVAGAAKGSLVVLITGLGLSIVLMAIAAAFVARMLARYSWIGWLGVAVIVYVAIEMIWRGAVELGMDRA